jgi:hypothetical protein
MYCEVAMTKVINSFTNDFGRGAHEMGRTLTDYACLLPAGFSRTGRPIYNIS